MMAAEARRLGLGVMVGNMVGTSLAMAPAFILGQLCDYRRPRRADLPRRGPHARASTIATARSAAATRSGAAPEARPRRRPRERAARAAAAEPTWFGQPRGLTILFLTNMWETILLLRHARAAGLLHDHGSCCSSRSIRSIIYGLYTALRLFHADHRRHHRRPLAGQAPRRDHRRQRHGRRPFHDGVRAGLLFRAGDDRARQRPVPADPAEPDQRPLPGRRSAPPLGLQRLLCRRECRRRSWRL